MKQDTNMKNNLVSIVLPTFNEKESIGVLVDEIHGKLAAYNHEILVVDDNSPDGTYQKLEELNHSHVRPILRTSDKGFANSIRCGIENANGDIIIIMDSDFNHQPKYLPFMIESLEFYDCIVASRFVYGGDMGSRSRHTLSWLFNIFVRLMTGGKVTDSLYGFIAIKKECMREVEYNKVFWGYGDYCIRLVYYLQKNGVSILQFPAVNGKRIAGEGNSRFLKVFKQYFSAVIELAYKIKFQKNV
jgi:dolichol-phosphate mannosyltransferase